MAKRKSVKRPTETKAGGRAIGFVMACQFAEMVAKRIVEMGHTIDTTIVAQVSGPLGLRPMIVADEEYQRLKRLKGGT